MSLSDLGVFKPVHIALLPQYHNIPVVQWVEIRKRGPIRVMKSQDTHTVVKIIANGDCNDVYKL